MKLSSYTTVTAQAQELGARLKFARLQANISQEELRLRAGISRTAVAGAECGKAHLETVLAIMGVLGMIDAADQFIPEMQPSPVQLAKLQGRQRKRASKSSVDSAKKPKAKVLDW
ncbi:helix-turn-helix domain-containing protein [Chitinolyticbacter albus]|uniref:helix-turn-helix domain-containing protein n=1 Tax=Chitinolyticbacter albus TaxID=2961951 RepID=UPI00210BC72C|nr:helix-turn-helix transcriptional regulator [Chitinolyticbacter albus]